MARLLRYNQRIVLYALSAYKPLDSFGWVTKVSWSLKSNCVLLG